MPLSLVEKIAAIAKTVPQIAKQGHNEAGGYDFIRAVDLFDAVRIKLFEAGVLIVPISQKSARSNPYLSVTGDITDEWIVEITYRITDGNSSSIEVTAHGVGQDHGGKALYMASTGAKKDLLKSIFLMAGVEDDPESAENTGRIPPTLAEKLDEMERQFGPDMREHPIDRIKVNAWMSACRKTGYSNKAQKTFLKTCGVEKISDLKRKDFDRAIKWATEQEELKNGEDSSGAESGTSEE